MSELAQKLIEENKQLQRTDPEKAKFLDLGNCGLKELPNELFECIWLEKLNLGTQYFELITEFEYDYLYKIDSAKNEVKENNLSLNINNNFESSSLKGIKKLTNLKEIFLKDVDIQDISEICELKNLEILSLTSNLNIKDFYPISKLKELICLFLPSTNVNELSFLPFLPNLIFLNLYNSKIIDTKFINNCLNLKWLRISNCKFLKKENIFLENLKGLKYLDLSSNEISDISFLENHTSLIFIDLSFNKIAEIKYLEKLLQLKHLILASNQIKDIKSLLPFLKNGLEIELHVSYKEIICIGENPIVNPPLEVVKQGREAIIEFFEGNQKQLNECKLIFVGDGGVGKTSLMRRIVSDSFKEGEKTTHGINKIAWEEIKNKESEKIRVNLWDFGGQHIQHSLHQFFFSERVIYVLVLNPRNDQKADYWLDQIEKLGCNSEIIVVYNWKQEEDKQADYLTNFYELRKKYPKLPDPFLLNCKLDEGIKPFKESLIGHVLRNEGLKAKYREEWFNIKRKLEDEVSVGKQFIPYETYQEWCIAEHYENPESQRRLLNILDSVGSIVFFDRPILNQYQVLNPDWITTGAYSILVATQTKEKRGHLSWDDLKEIFKEEKEIFANKAIKIRYLEQNFHFLLELMLQYNLCERNPNNDKEFLIPSAFGERPSKDYKFAKDEARYYRLQFESPFEMLIMHRFIAKNIKKIESKDYWQSGIYIKHHDNKTFALVETNLFSKRVDCWIKGNNINGFWEIIQNDFKEIFEIYNDFPVQQLVKYNHPEKEVFLDYEEMLDALRNGKNIIDYDSKNRIKNIDVLEVLSLFEDKEKTLVKMKEQNKGDIHIHNEGTMNIGGVGNNSTNEQNISKLPATEPIKEEKKEDISLENNAFKKWQQNSLWLMLLSLTLTSLIVLGIIEEVSWIASKEMWVTFKQSDWFKWLGFIGAFAWNGFIGKMVYDRYYDPAKEKNFRDLFKVKSK